MGLNMKKELAKEEAAKEALAKIKAEPVKPQVKKFIAKLPYIMIQGGEEGNVYKQEGIIYNAKFEKTGEYPYTPPKPVDEKGKEVVAFPKDKDGKPKFTSKMIHTFIQRMNDTTIYIQNGEQFDDKLNYVGKYKPE